MPKWVWSIEPTDNQLVITRQVEVDEDDDGNAIFNTKKICRENATLAANEIRASLDVWLKQALKDEQPEKKEKK